LKLAANGYPVKADEELYMLMFILTLACILTAAVIGQQHASMQRLKRVRVRKDEGRDS
jgi:hypothetical protein